MYIKYLVAISPILFRNECIAPWYRVSTAWLVWDLFMLYNSITSGKPNNNSHATVGTSLENENSIPAGAAPQNVIVHPAGTDVPKKIILSKNNAINLLCESLIPAIIGICTYNYKASKTSFLMANFLSTAAPIIAKNMEDNSFPPIGTWALALLGGSLSTLIINIAMNL